MPDLSPSQCAALAAPVVDHVFRQAMRAMRDRGGRDLTARYGGPGVAGWLIDLRTRLAAPDGRIDPLGLEAVYRYGDPAGIEAAVQAGLLARDALRATDRGHAFLTELRSLHSRVLSEHWSGPDERIDRLLDVFDRLLRAGLATAGRAFATMAPPYEPPGTPPAVRLLDALGTWRYHRADAHALAGRVAGYTPAAIVALPPGPERDAIEAETNRLNGRGYEILSPATRRELLADLGALSLSSGAL
jgi:hypothetical protein